MKIGNNIMNEIRCLEQHVQITHDLWIALHTANSGFKSKVEDWGLPREP